MKCVRRILIALHLFVGIGAMAGGSAAITNPIDPLGAPVDLLKNSPFSNFLVPGIILFTVIGLGNLFSAYMFRHKLDYQGYISSVISWALVFWIVIQCFMLNSIAVLHVIFFLIGLVQAGLSFLLLIEKNQFPANLVLLILKKMNINFNLK